MNLPGTNRQWIALAAVTVLAFSATFLIPEAPPIKASRLATELPRDVGDWISEPVPIGERELAILANDTSFERKAFQNAYDSTLPDVLVSIVFSGKELSNSIHRPEICLRAQGWDFVGEGYANVKGVLRGEDLPVKELVLRRVRLGQDGKPLMTPEGKPVYDWQLLQYTFIGHEKVTPGHYQRTFIDIQDRLLGGYDQVWAYATFATTITGAYVDQGLGIGAMRNMDLEESREFLAEFMGVLLPRVVSAPGPANP